MPSHVNSASVDASFTSDGTAVTFAFDSSSASERVVMGVAVWHNASAHTMADSAVTYNSVALTPFGATIAAGATSQRWYYLPGPAADSNTFSFDPSTGTATLNAVLTAQCYSGVDQTTPQDGYASTSGTSTAAAVTVVSAAGDMPVIVAGCRALSPTASAPTNYTERFDNVNSNIAAGGGDGVGSSDLTMTCTFTLIAMNNWIAMGCNLNAAAAAAGVTIPVFDHYYRRRRAA